MRRLVKTAPITLRTFLSWLVCCGAFTVARAAPPDIRFVPEMERVAELEWSRADAKDFADAPSPVFSPVDFLTQISGQP